MMMSILPASKPAKVLVTSALVFVFKVGTLPLVTNKVVFNPTDITSFTSQGVNLYGFDTSEPYNTVGNVASGLNLTTLNATSAGRARFVDILLSENDDGFGVEETAGSNNTNRVENGEQLVIGLGVASKSTSVALSNLAAGEVATWETYNAAGVFVSSGTTAGAEAAPK